MEQKEQKPEQLMKLEEAAKQLNVEKITLLRAIAAGKLQAVKLGRGYQVTQSWLNDYVRSLTVNTVENVNRSYGTTWPRTIEVK